MSNRYQFDEKGHVHTLDGRPLVGTSSVGSVIAKPLTWWASGLAVKVLGVPDPKVFTKIKNKKATKEEIALLNASANEAKLMIADMSLDAYVKLLDQAYRAHQSTLADKAEEGVDLHAELERFVKDQMTGTEPLTPYADRIQPFIDWTKKRVKRFLWSEVHCFSEKHWVGGISDCGFEDVDGKIGIMDFKSSKEAYLSQFWQAGGYAIEVEENGGFDKDGNQTHGTWKVDYLAILPFGMEKPEPQINVDVPKCKEMFLHEVAIYNALPHD